MEEIFFKNILIGIKITTIRQGSIPITKDHESVQIVTLSHPKGTYLKAHMHKPTERRTNKLQECLIVKKGRIKIDLYSPDNELFKDIELDEGEVFLLTNGGYGIHLLEDSELIEMKNGPFIEDKVLI